ncbi:MAG: hypothetical protein R2754_07420 [Microthrixaceae bacterium]
MGCTRTHGPALVQARFSGDCVQRTFLFDMVHPADFHFFVGMISEVERRGDRSVVATRHNDVLVELADEAQLEHVVASTAGSRSRLREANELVTRVGRLCGLIRRHRVDLVLARNPAGALAARLLRVPSIYDTDDGPAAGILHWMSAVPATVITSPAAGDVDYGRKHVSYEGYKETASLRPERFEPDDSIVASAGVDPTRPFSLVRLVAMESTHDHGEAGLDDDALAEVVRRLEPLGQVWISSERALPEDLEAQRLSRIGSAFRHVLARSQLLVGDSQTTAAEAAILGVPSLRLSSWSGRLPYLTDLEEREMTQSFQPSERADFLTRLDSLVGDIDAERQKLALRRDELLEATVDVTDWMVDYMYRLVDNAVIRPAELTSG